MSSGLATARVGTSTPGTSYPGLVAVELRRLWWRRLSKALLVITVLFTGATVYGAYQSTSTANLAQRVAAYEQSVRDFPEMVQQCQRAQSDARADGDPEADFGCQQMTPPTLEDFGITSPDAGALFAELAETTAYLYAFLALVLGASLVGAEYSAGSLSTWLTFEPRRIRVASSKLVATGMAGAALAAVGLALTAAGTWVVTQVNRPDPSLRLPVPTTPDDPVSHLLLRCLAVAVIAAVTGSALALVARNTGAVVAVVLGYAVVVEGILAQALGRGHLTPWLPVRNVEAFLARGTSYHAQVCESAGSCQYTSLTLSYTHGWVYLLVAVPLLLAFALAVFRRRDVD
jgi:ABC-2 type transport system permease protein